MIGRWERRAASLALCVAMFPAISNADVPEPAGYRGEPYRAPVPATLRGATAIDAATAISLHDQGVPFLDTLPLSPKPEGLPSGTLWNAPDHLSIPGAVWLWNTGYDRLAPAEEKRLADGLMAATRGDKIAPVVVFCKTDCWMSWNAGKRAVAMGYTGVHWFPGGIEGWQEAGGAPLVKAEPVSP